MKYYFINPYQDDDLTLYSVNKGEIKNNSLYIGYNDKYKMDQYIDSYFYDTNKTRLIDYLKSSRKRKLLKLYENYLNEVLTIQEKQLDNEYEWTGPKAPF